MSRLAIWFNIGWNNISYSKSIYRVKREREGTTLDITSAVMAENGCMRVGQTSSVYTLPSYILERAVGAFENLWFSPAEYSQRQDAEVKRSPRLSSTGKDAVYSVVVGHY